MLADGKSDEIGEAVKRKEERRCCSLFFFCSLIEPTIFADEKSHLLLAT